MVERKEGKKKKQFETIRSVGFFLVSQRQLTAGRKKVR